MEDKKFNIPMANYRLANRYHAELTRFSTWLFASIMVTMTFLLLAGLRNPRTLLVVFMYVAIASFALVVLIHPLLHLWNGQLMTAVQEAESAVPAKARSKKAAAEAAAASSPTAGLESRVKVLRVAQQVLFVVGLLATVGFAVEVSLYLFVTAAPAGASGQAGA
jgi:hypothetical protein